MALGITLWLYILKAIKQVNYKGDERWKLIQLKANNAANLAHSILIVLIAILPLFINMRSSVIGIPANMIQIQSLINISSDYKHFTLSRMI